MTWIKYKNLKKTSTIQNSVFCLLVFSFSGCTLGMWMFWGQGSKWQWHGIKPGPPPHVPQWGLLNPFFWIVLREDSITLHSHSQTYEVALFLKAEIFKYFSVVFLARVDRIKCKMESDYWLAYSTSFSYVDKIASVVYAERAYFSLGFN